MALALEAHPGLGVAGRGPQYLDRYLAAQVLLLGPVDVGEATAADAYRRAETGNAKINGLVAVSHQP
jgi:hypothetical protein